MNAFKRLWSRFWGPAGKISLGVLLAGGFVLGIAFWGGFHWALEATNNQTFCISCHEMRDNVYAEYRGSVHEANASGVRATCPDCHVPREWGPKMVRKIQASKEVWGKITGYIDTREKFEEHRLSMAVNEWTRMKKNDSQECRNCHSLPAMDITKQSPRARPLHLDAEAKGQTCIDCHKGIAHELPQGAFEAEKTLNELFPVKAKG